MSRYQHTPAEVRIKLAMAKTPYGAIAKVHTASRRVGFRDGEPEPIDLDDVGAYLEALAGELDRISDDHAVAARKLAQFESDVAAVRRMFGCER